MKPRLAGPLPLSTTKQYFTQKSWATCIYRKAQEWEKIANLIEGFWERDSAGNIRRIDEDMEGEKVIC
jgi:hypothetical protein